jgi:6-phosphogluconolactonase
MSDLSDPLHPRFDDESAKVVLARVGWTNSLGRTPRFFTLDPTGSSVVVANEDRDSIIAFEVDPWTGVLERGREVARTGSSVCIVFATTA